jgi:hypothetical protein
MGSERTKTIAAPPGWSPVCGSNARTVRAARYLQPTAAYASSISRNSCIQKGFGECGGESGNRRSFRYILIIKVIIFYVGLKVGT